MIDNKNALDNLLEVTSTNVKKLKSLKKDRMPQETEQSSQKIQKDIEKREIILNHLHVQEGKIKSSL